MKKILIFLLFICSLTACTTPEYDIYSTLYGVVSDHETGDLIPNATLVLSPGGRTAVTGNDGYFEFQELTPQQYSITVQKEGYKTNRKSVNAVSGESIEINIPLSK